MSSDVDAFLADSQTRLDRLRPSDTLKGLFIRRYLELFEELGGPALREKGCAALGQPRVVDFFNYPYASVVHMGLAVVHELAPRYGGVEPWLFEMGRLATQSYLKSFLGRAFLAGFRPAPKTMLEGMPWAIKTTFSFGKRAVTLADDTHALFACRDDASAAPSNAGAIHAAIVSVGAVDPVVRIESFDLFNYDLHVSWR